MVTYISQLLFTFVCISMKMSKSTKISLLFILIFLLGVITYITIINHSLNKKSEILIFYPITTEKTV